MLICVSAYAIGFIQRDSILNADACFVCGEIFYTPCNMVNRSCRLLCPWSIRIDNDINSRFTASFSPSSFAAEATLKRVQAAAKAKIEQNAKSLEDAIKLIDETQSSVNASAASVNTVV